MKKSRMILSAMRNGTLVLTAGLLMTVQCLLVPVTANAGDDLDENLTQVPAAYAEAYVTPVVVGSAANLTSGLYTNAAIGKEKLTFEFGLKFMGTYLNESDQSFRSYQTVKLNEELGFNPGHPLYGRDAVLEYVGPTVLGGETGPGEDGTGQANLYVDGVIVRSEDTIAGIVETRWVPLAIPEASVGGIAGFRFTLRFLPSISISDLGKLQVLGLGAQFGVNNLLQDLPIDVVVGYFYQNVDIGESLSTDANSFFLGLSRTSGVLTIYGGGALESSTTKVDYTWKSGNATLGDVPISFEIDGVQDYRLTIGAMIDAGIRINAEANAGDLVVYSAGLMFGF